jgi:hypothetical protein
MKSFIKTALVFLIPFYLVVAAYFVFDPFKVLYKKDLSSSHFVILNRDFVSTEKFKINYTHEKFNSFIFGSSRTLAFKTKDWAPHLDPNAKTFVFDASGETIYGIWKKIKYLNENSIKIENSVLIFCGDVTFSMSKNYDDHIRIKHPNITDESRLFFHGLFFSTYFSNGFFARYLDYLMFKTERPYMKSFLEFRSIHSDLITNDLFINDQEKLIQDDSIHYYNLKKALFYKRDNSNKSYPIQINSEMKQMLSDIKTVFRENNTNYKIIVSPLYNQTKLNPEDLNVIKEIFGTDNVFDYSGINNITNSKYNYYEDSHYRYHVGKRILSEIYSPDSLLSIN